MLEIHQEHKSMVRKNMKRMVVWLALPVVAMIASLGHACSLAPKAYDPVVYWSEKEPNQVVFQARVRSISEREIEQNEQRFEIQDIEFRPIRWWRGGAGHEIIVGQGSFGGGDRTSCAGVFDFAVNEGDDWLIVGHASNGVVYPSGLLSKKLIDGKIPKEYLGIFESATAKVKSSGVIEWKTGLNQRDTQSAQRRFRQARQDEMLLLALGDAIAVRFEVEAPEKKKVRLRSVFESPIPIVVSGQKSPRSRIETVGEWAVGELQQASFIFDADQKLAAGTWFWELWDDETRIASRNFRITVDRAMKPVSVDFGIPMKPKHQTRSQLTAISGPPDGPPNRTNRHRSYREVLVQARLECANVAYRRCPPLH
ncbi:hypothetical protein [Variovorax sp. tm]|uniref:hypothetical protein n=1 Tax=Variovorax atrisoli TaxID=3394203 RepID=UPI003A812E3C